MKRLFRLQSIVKINRSSILPIAAPKCYSSFPSQFNHLPNGEEEHRPSEEQINAAIDSMLTNRQKPPQKSNPTTTKNQEKAVFGMPGQDQQNQMLLMMLQANHVDITHGQQVLTFIESFFQKRNFESETLEMEGQKVTALTNLKQVIQTILLFATILRFQKSPRGRSTCITMLFQAIESVVAKPFLFDQPKEARNPEEAFYSAADLEKRFAEVFRIVLTYPDTPVALLCHNLIIDFHLQFNSSVLRTYGEISKMNTEEKYGARYNIYKAFACYLYSSYLLKHKTKVLETEPSMNEADIEKNIVEYFDLANKIGEIGAFHSLRSVWYGNQHQFEKSLEHIQKAIIIEPTNPDFMLLQCDFYIQIPDFAKAIECTQRALKFASIAEEQIPIYAKQTSLLVWSLEEATLKKVMPNAKLMLDLILANGLSRDVFQISELMRSMFMNQIPIKVTEKHPEIEKPIDLVQWLNYAVEAMVYMRMSKEDAVQRVSFHDKAKLLLQEAKKSAELLKENPNWKFGEAMWQDILNNLEGECNKLDSSPKTVGKKK